MTNYVGSSASMIKHTSTTGGRRFLYSDVIDVNKPALVALGGALTTNETKAFGYIENLRNAIRNKSDVDLFAAVYKFESLDPMLIKANAFRRAGRKIRLDMDANIAQRKETELGIIYENEPTPGYIEDLYDIIIAPRIIRGNTALTAKNLRGVILYSHCHGAIVVNQLADMAEQQMKSTGFKNNEIKQCLSNVIVVQHNPTAPLENARFTTLNFISASDDTLDYFDNFSKAALKRDDLTPSFIGNKYANVFVASKLYVADGSEHGFSAGYQDNGSKLTPNGKVIFAAEQNAINNAIDAAVAHAPMPSIEQLVTGNNVNIEQMRNNGMEILKRMGR